MKKAYVKSWIVIPVVMAGLSWSAGAAQFTWDGGGDSNLGTAANWVGDVAPNSSPALVFTGSGATLNNNLTGQISGITFTADAGAFTIGGNNFANLYGNLTNNSASTQTFNSNVAMGYADRTFTTYGDLVFNAGIGQLGGSYSLYKTGIGTMTLRGANTYAGLTRTIAGKLVVDLANGGSFAGGGIQFGSDTRADSNTATVQIKGDTGGNTLSFTGVNAMSRALYINSDAAAKLIVTSTGGAATTVNFSNYTRYGSSSLNFDISSPNTSVVFSAGPTLTNGVISGLLTTVTDSTATGFATLDNGAVKRLNTFAGSIGTATINAGTSNYTIAGNQNLGGNYINVYTLTITGGGSLTSTHTTGGLQAGAVLMQEGAGDFTLSSAGSVTTPIFHQYSTNGTLIVSGTLKSAANTLTKTGPGAMRISNTGIGAYTGVTLVQGGLLDLDGVLTTTSSVTVFSEATLSGGGSTSSVLIRSGGKLAASSSEALALSGSLTLQDYANVEFTLGAGSDSITASGNITLGNFVNLSLTLDADLNAGDNFVLLTSSGGSLAGSFATINGATYGIGDTFVLDYNGKSYTSQLLSANNQISMSVISVVPEPSSWVLLTLGFGSGLVWLRRTRKG